MSARIFAHPRLRLHALSALEAAHGLRAQVIRTRHRERYRYRLELVAVAAPREERMR